MKTLRSQFVLAACSAGLLFVCGPAKAQIQTIGNSTVNPADSSYAGGGAPSQSGINAELETGVMRDTNVFGNNAAPYSDFVYQESAVINLWKAQPRWNIALQYRPTFLHYQHESSLNSFDQGLEATGRYSFSPKLQLEGTETVARFTGLFPYSSNQYLVLPTSGFPGVNTAIIAPTSHELSTGSEGNILYQVSPRGSIDLTGGYALENFTGIKNVPQTVLSPTLLDTNSATGGVAYQYRYTQRVTLGLRYMYQYFHYGFGGSDESHTGYLIAHWDIWDHAGLDLYGGPSYSTAIGTQFVTATTKAPLLSYAVLSPAFGGTFSIRSDRTVVNINAQHAVSSGGGLLMTVMSDSAGAEIRHQLTDNWDFVVLGSYDRSVALQSSSSKGKLDSETIGTAFERLFFSKLGMHFEYDYSRQRVNQFVPLGTNVNMNQFSVALFYRLGEPHLQ
jgi:hypothetical protein